MGYKALLFCPDEKTARTVTQVLSELDFAVEASTEPFAVVKKLMSEHFDAVVVDCDNEQNATLLFKSARNSASNQTSLAVAVVEGQAGVAKAFRIGANLVLTKPINVEQAKGTLRVARGLLRKSEPAKPAPKTPVSAPTAAANPATTMPATPTVATAHAVTPVKPAPPKPVASPKPAVAAPKTVAPQPRPQETPVAKPAIPAWSRAAASAAPPETPEDDLLEIDADELEGPGAIAVQSAAIEDIPPVVPTPAIVVPVVAAQTKAVAVAKAQASGGAASAAAPALAPEASVAANPSVDDAPADLEKPIDSGKHETGGSSESAPMFTFGGANVPADPAGGSKKILFGVAAVVLLAAAGYIGWTQFGALLSHSTVQSPITSVPAQHPKPNTPATPVSSAPQPGSTLPPANQTESAPEEPTPSDVKAAKAAKPASTPSAGKSTEATDQDAPATTKITAPAKPETAPLLVKGGKAPVAKVADTVAPSMVGMASPVTPPVLISTGNSAFKPQLQSMSISQGVSQGLLMKKVEPIYPELALHLRVEGPVQILATISKDGNITHTKVLSGDPQLTPAALSAVKQWKYKPYLLNGEPVEIQTQITVKFKLPD